MRSLRRLAIVLVVLAALFTAADRIAVGVAESQAASRIQAARGLTAKPSVAIEGFPFLTQLAAQRLDEVKLSAQGLTVADGSGRRLTLHAFHADLRGVRLVNGFSSATVSRATGSALIAYPDLSAALPNHLTAGYGGTDAATGAGRVKLTGSVQVLGRTLRGSATADLSVSSGDSIGLSNAEIEHVTGVSSIAAAALGPLFDTTLKVSGIPVGLRLSGIAARPDGVLVSLTGADLSLTG